MRSLGVAARWLVTAALLAVALYQAPPQQWLPVLSSVRWEWMAVAALLMAVIVVVNTWKWGLLLGVQGIRPGFLRLLYHYAVGYFFNSFITGTGDLKRATDLGREQAALPEAMASVLAERWTGVLGQVALASATILAAFTQDPGALWPLTLTAGGLCAALVLGYLWFEDARPGSPRSPKGLAAWVHRLRLAVGAYRGQRRVWWSCLGLSLVGPLLLVLIHIVLAEALGVSAPARALLLFVPTVSVFAQLPITINGFGLQDYFMVTLLRGTLDPARAMALSLAFHALRLATGASGGLLYALVPSLGQAHAQRKVCILSTSRSKTLR